MSFAQYELEVIRHNEKCSAGFVTADYSLLTRNAAVDMGRYCHDPALASKAVGEAISSLILYCASRDVDLTDCLRQHVEGMK